MANHHSAYSQAPHKEPAPAWPCVGLPRQGEGTLPTPAGSGTGWGQLPQPGGTGRRAPRFPRSRAISGRICSASGRGAGLRLWLAEQRGSRRWRLRCLSRQSHPFPFPASLPAKAARAAAGSPARKPPWESPGTGVQHDGDGRGSGCHGGALEPDHGMLADLGGCQQPAKLRAGFVLSRTLRGPTNQSNTRVSSRRSRSGTFLVQGV